MQHGFAIEGPRIRSMRAMFKVELEMRKV